MKDARKPWDAMLTTRPNDVETLIRCLSRPHIFRPGGLRAHCQNFTAQEYPLKSIPHFFLTFLSIFEKSLGCVTRGVGSRPSTERNLNGILRPFANQDNFSKRQWQSQKNRNSKMTIEYQRLTTFLDKPHWP